MTMPNFLIIGAMKAGTTSLYYYLGQHPQIYMSPKKEPRFFALEGEKLDYRGPHNKKATSDSITNIKDYCALFQGVSIETAIGEASPLYLYSPKAPDRIKHYIPDAKLIVMLRDPAERAYSNFLHGVREGWEPLVDFAEALEQEETRVRNNWSYFWHYKRRGFYYTQLKRYFEKFDRTQIRVYLFEDWQSSNIKILHDIFRYLNVDDTYVPDSYEKYNVSGIPKIKTLHQLLHRPNPIRSALKPFLPRRLRGWVITNIVNRNLVRPQLPSEVRRQLVELYREDILKLQDLIQRDLSNWLQA